jgi:hypothetical protein
MQPRKKSPVTYFDERNVADSFTLAHPLSRRNIYGNEIDAENDLEKFPQ